MHLAEIRIVNCSPGKQVLIFMQKEFVGVVNLQQYDNLFSVKIDYEQIDGVQKRASSSR